MVCGTEGKVYEFMVVGVKKRGRIVAFFADLPAGERSTSKRNGRSP